MSLNIEKFLLSVENSSRFENSTVATQLNSKSVEHLWSERSLNIDTVVVHFMSDRFRSPENPYERDKLISIFLEYEVSAHYLILRDGKVLQLVPEEEKAWHAGGSIMPDPDNRVGVNEFSIGIELAGSELEPFTEMQYCSLKEVLKGIKSRHAIKNIVGHEDISGEQAVVMGLRKDVKIDPGPQFHWEIIL